MTENQYRDWSKVRIKILTERKKGRLSAWGAEVVAKLYSDTFRKKFVSPCRNCGKIYLTFIQKLETEWYKSHGLYKKTKEKVNKT